MPPSDAESEAEDWVLSTDAGRALLAEAQAIRSPGPAELSRWRKSALPIAVSAAVRLAECRRRGATKFTRAGQMWLDPVALEQATAEPVAAYKAQRFAPSGRLVIDLCSGIGGDALALASVQGASVLALDRDQGMCRRIHWNARVYEVSERIQVIRGDAERIAWPAGSLVHIDPDRRAGPDAAGRRREQRARNLGEYVPDLGFLRTLPRRAAGGAIKLGPASDFADHFGAHDVEIELISLAGECKEATVWFGGLATCRRRATCLPAGASWTDRDGGLSAIVPVAPPSAWIYDPDPALVRAGLLDGFAAAHGLARCAPGIDFLTSAQRVESPWLAAFETLEVLPLDLRTLKRVVATRSLGPLEIKTRGVDLRPETLRTQLRPRGSTPATLLLHGGHGASRAILARRP